MSDFRTNLLEINTRIQQACKKSGRSPDEIRLLLATKTVSADRIIEAFGEGQTLIGENKTQELKAKFEALKEYSHEKHFIGHLQSNKIKEVIRYGVSCIHSVDRLDLAQKLNERLELEKRSMDILIQINTSAEQSKFGLRPEEVLPFVQKVAMLPALRVKGFMTIGIFNEEPEITRPCFQLLKSIADSIERKAIPNVETRVLSMGMSRDLEVAIEEGATILRVGTALFGKRIYPDSYYWNETSTPKSN